MSFTNPEVFWTLLLLIPSWFLLQSSYLKGKSELLKVGGAWRGHHLHSVYLLKSFFSGVALLLTFVFLITAWAGPSWGSLPVEEPQDGLDIALCIDISRSMAATDVQPSRLEQAREAVRSLLGAFPGARFSLVGFEGTGVTFTPLTPDKAVLERWLEELSPSLTSVPGTNLESGLEEALRTVDFSSQRHKAVIVLSDGEYKDGNPSVASRLAASRATVVYTIGIGTADGAPIPAAGGSLKDTFGFPVVTKLNEGALRLIASDTGGHYLDGTSRANMRELQDLLSTLGNPAARGGVKLESVPRYRVFLLLALATLTSFLLVRIVPWKGVF
ncbi:MAG: VWA domain-containing protein [Spirochaetales bacterium]